jgi:hypothetical protein
VVIVFSLPFCLLLPDGDYEVKLGENDIVTINLTKVIPKIFDERLPYRGFLKGEIEDISKLRVMDSKTSISKEITVEDISNINSLQYLIHYITKDGKKITPQIDPGYIAKDVNLFDNIIINPNKFKRVIKDTCKNEIDITDDVLSQKRELGRTLTINSEIAKDRFGRFRYSKIRYTSNKNLHSKDEFIRAIRAVNLLIDKYRALTNDYWITRIRENDIFLYMNVREDSFDCSHVEKGISQIRTDHDEKIVNSLKQELFDMKPEFPFIHLRLDALNAFEEGKYHLSIIYIITALESLVKTFLDFYFSKNYLDIKKQILKMPLHNLITIILRLIVSSDELTNLISNIKSAITLRNKIIHEAELNVSEKQAKKIIEDVTKFFEFLRKQFGNIL